MTSTDLFRLDGKVAVVTGASSGLGVSFAQALAAAGADVALGARRVDRLADTAELVTDAGRRALSVATDVAEPESCTALVQAAMEEFGRVDILVNNAGGQFPSPAQHISPKGFAAVVKNNLLGTFNFTHAVANTFLIPQRRGRIVNVIAQVARGFPGMAHTGAARAGVDNLTKSLAVEWAQFGVRVNAVAPGVIKTTGTKQYPPELLENAVKMTPLHRLGHADEVSHLIVYLASTYADFITGQSFYIDGGQSIWGDQWPIPDDVPKFPPYE